MAMAKVLVIDDDKFLVSTYRAGLTRAGFEVRIGTDGDQALEQLKSFTPDIIVLDLVLPKKDGFLVLETLKASKQFKDIPVVVVSNLGQHEDLDRAMSLGVADYLIKTDLSLDSVATKLREILRSNKSED